MHLPMTGRNWLAPIESQSDPAKLAFFAPSQESCSSLYHPLASYKASSIPPVEKNRASYIRRNPKKRARYIWPKWRRNYHAQQSKNASPWAHFGWSVVDLPGERRGAHWAPRSDFFSRLRLGKPKNLWIALPKNLEKASKRAFRDSKKNAPS